MNLSKRFNSPWTSSQGFVILLAFMALYIALSATHMFWVKQTVGFEQYLKNSSDFYIKVLVFGQAIKAFSICVVIYFLAIKKYSVSLKALGFIKTTPRWLTISVFIALIGFILRILLMKWMAVEIPEWARFMKPPVRDLSMDIFLLTGFLFLTVIITPIAEEIFFRGFLFQWMAGRRPWWIAALVSSVMFGASHIIPPQAISAALMSLALIYLFVASGSIWPPILCHIINNLISIGGNLLAAANLLPTFLMPPV